MSTIAIDNSIEIPSLMVLLLKRLYYKLIDNLINLKEGNDFINPIVEKKSNQRPCSPNWNCCGVEKGEPHCLYNVCISLCHVIINIFHES